MNYTIFTVKIAIAMFSKKKEVTTLDLEQHELLENAQQRIRQKKKLFTHFVIFLIGSVFIILINKIFKYGDPYNWFIWAITAWAFIFSIHAFTILVSSKFMGKAWERAERERLVIKQKQRIAALQKEIETDFPVSQVNKKKEL